MSINGFKRAVQSSNDDSAAQDLICKKGFAVSARSRGYDHKDAFEPAQGATAPPSDADELGAWLKYEGSAPVPAAQAKAVSEEELPTSWYKYETKPIASLTAAELRRTKVLLHPNETTAAAYADTTAQIAPPTAVETAPAEEQFQGALGDREDTGYGTETEAKAETFDPLKLPAVQAETVVDGAIVMSENAEPGDATTQDSSAEPSAEAHEPAEHDSEPTTAAAVFAPSETAAVPELPEPISVLGPTTTPAIVPMLEPSQPEAKPAPPEAPEPMEPAAELEQALPAICTPERSDAIAPELEIDRAPPTEPVEITTPEPEPQRAAPTVATLALSDIPAPEPDLEPTTSAVSVLELAEILAPASEPEQATPAAYSQEFAELPTSELEPEQAAPAVPALALSGIPAPEPDLEQATSAVSVLELAEVSAPASEPEQAPAAYAQEFAELPAPELRPEQATPTVPALALIEISASESEPDASTASTQELVEISASERQPTTAPISELEPAVLLAAEPDPAISDVSGPIALDIPGLAPVSDYSTEPGGSAPRRTQQTTKKAKLARLAAMLERMLAAKRSVGNSDQQGNVRLEVVEALPEAPEAEGIELPQLISPSAEMPAQIEIADDAAPEDAEERLVPIEQTAALSPEESFSEPEAVSPGVAEIDASADESPLYAAPPELPLAPLSPSEEQIEQARLAQDRGAAESDASDTDLVLPVAPAMTASEHLTAPAPDALPEISTETVALAMPDGISGEVAVPIPPEIPQAEAGATENEPWPVPPSEGTPVELPANLGVESPKPVWSASELAVQDYELPIDQIVHTDMGTESPAPPEVAQSPDEPRLSQSIEIAVAIQGDEALVEPSLDTDPLAHHDAPPPEPTTELSVAVEPIREVVDVPSETTPAAASAPPNAAEAEKATRAALASDLADIIHEVLSTTSFASRATLQTRGFGEPMPEGPDPVEPPAEPDELADEALPHPVAIRSRLARMERIVALASLGMMVVVGYFAFSLWQNHDGDVAQTPVTTATGAMHSSLDSWGERTRDITRDLNPYATDASKALTATPILGGGRSTDGTRPKSRDLQGVQ